jgi:solute carrier family 35 protein E1
VKSLGNDGTLSTDFWDIAGPQPELPKVVVEKTHQMTTTIYVLNSIKNTFDLSIQHSYTHLLLWTAISYTCGFLLTNLALSLASASFTETIKSGEPITSVIFGYVVLHEKSHWFTYISLIPIIIGVALSCISDTSFHLHGAIFAAISNICFSLRAVIAKKILMIFPTESNEFVMFRQISLIGVCVLIPLAYIVESVKISNDFIFELDDSFKKIRYDLFILFLWNGLAYTCYNLVSFLVLKRSNIVTHAVLNCFRRVFIIIFTSYYFQMNLSNYNLLGVGVALSGAILFGTSKRLSEKRAVDIQVN